MKIIKTYSIRTLFILLLVSGQLNAQIELLNENFDSSIPLNWTQWSPGFGSWNHSADEGVNSSGAAFSFAFSSDPSQNVWLQTPWLDLTQVSNPILEMSGRIDATGTIPPELTFWYDNGGGWVLINTGWTFSAMVWEDKTADLSSFSNESNIRFSFGAEYPDSGSSGGFVMVDNVKVSGQSTAGLMTMDPNGIRVYPNPVEDELNVTGAGGGDRFSLYTMDGRLLMNDVDLSTGSIQFGHLSSGIYRAVIRNSSGVISTINVRKK